jgi:DHA2 family multidrug resistance protein-like MFS transporter
MLPAAAASMVSFVSAPFLAQRIRPAYVIAVGMAIATIGCFLFVTADADGGLVPIIVGLAVMNLGAGPAVTLGTNMVLSAVPSSKAGSAGAMSETSSEFGYAMGIASLGSVATVVYRAGLDVPAGIPDDLAAQARESLAGAVSVATELDSAGLLASARDAFMDSVHVVGWVTAAVAVVIGVMDGIFFRHLPPIGNDEKS